MQMAPATWMFRATQHLLLLLVGAYLASAACASGGEKPMLIGLSNLRFVGIAPDNRAALLCGDDEQNKLVLQRYPLSGKTAGKAEPLPLSPTNGLMALRDDRFYICANAGYTVFNLADGKKVDEIKHPNPSEAAKGVLTSFNPATGTAYYFAPADKKLYGVAMKTGKELFRVDTPDPAGFRSSGNGNWLLVPKGGGVFTLIDAATGAAQELAPAKANIECALPSNDGKRVYYVTTPATKTVVRIPFSLMSYDRDEAKAKPLRDLPDRLLVRRMVASANEKYIALAGEGTGTERVGRVYVVDVKNARIVKDMELPLEDKKGKAVPDRMAFSADELKLIFDLPQQQAVQILNLPR